MRRPGPPPIPVARGAIQTSGPASRIGPAPAGPGPQRAAGAEPGRGPGGGTRVPDVQRRQVQDAPRSLRRRPAGGKRRTPAGADGRGRRDSGAGTGAPRRPTTDDTARRAGTRALVPARRDPLSRPARPQGAGLKPPPAHRERPALCEDSGGPQPFGALLPPPAEASGRPARSWPRRTTAVRSDDRSGEPPSARAVRLGPRQAANPARPGRMASAARGPARRRAVRRNGRASGPRRAHPRTCRRQCPAAWDPRRAPCLTRKARSRILTGRAIGGKGAAP